MSISNLPGAGLSRRRLLQLAAGSAALGLAGRGRALTGARLDASPPSGAVGFTSFIHPAARIKTRRFAIGAQSLIEGFVSLEGRAAHLGHGANLQDNDRLLDDRATGPSELWIGDGSFTAHNVTFIGRVRIGEACGTVIGAVLRNARVGDASITGFTARILGSDPFRPIEIPEASLVLFGARIGSQDEVAANIIPVPAPFSLFASDVTQENLLLARGYNLLYRAAARITPFSAEPGDPRNPGADFPDLTAAFGTLSVAPPTVDRRGTGVLPARQASLNDLGFEVFQPLSPVPTPSTLPPDQGGSNAPPADSDAAGARFIDPRVATPELIDPAAIVLGGVELAAGVVVGAGSYLHAADTPAISVGADSRIGRNVSLHELTYTSLRIGANVVVGDRAVLHGPLEIGDGVTIGAGAVLFGPRVAAGVRIGDGALIFGPLEITSDVPAGAILVPPGNEFLIAPSHTGARAALRPAAGMLAQWRRVQQAGHRCGCGLGGLLHALA